MISSPGTKTRRLARLLRAGALAALTTALAGNALADERDCLPLRPMEGWEVRSELAGHELRGYSVRTDARWSEQLHDDGITEFRNARGELTTGRWRLSGGALCFTYGTMTEWTCKTVQRAPARCNLFRYALVDDDGRIASAILETRRLRAGGRGYDTERYGGRAAGRSDLTEAVEREKSWSPSVRMGVQNALVWSGDYRGRLDGDFGQGTRDAIRRFQRRIGTEATGYLTTREIEMLERERLAAVRAAGFEVVDDTETGIRMGLPLALFRRAEVRDTMVVYDTVTGEPGAGLALVSMRGDRRDLMEQHRRLSRRELAGNDPYTVVKPDWFVIAGEVNGVKSYTYLHAEAGTLKGFILTWPGRSDARYTHLAVAMLNSFETIPGLVLRGGVADSGPRGGGIDDLAGRTPGGRGKAEARARPRRQDRDDRREDRAPPEGDLAGTGSGFVVTADGAVLTNAHVVEECRFVTIGDGTPATVETIDRELDLAILRTRGATWPAIARFAAGPARLNSDVTVIGYPLHGILGGINVTRGAVSSPTGLGGRNSEFQISAAVQPGNSGGPVLNASGAVVGIVRSKLDAVEVAGITGDIPQNINFAIRGEAAKVFLAANGVFYETADGAETIAPADLAEAAQAFTVLVNCFQ